MVDLTGEEMLTRAFLEAGGVDRLVARDAPNLRILTEAERNASLHAFLAARPAGPVWLFGYGSLIWNPTVRNLEARTARIEGWHRAFSLSASVGRGSPENPGLVLALDAGGSCTGIAYRLDDAGLEGELDLLWRREMLSGAYVPRWLDLGDPDGRRFGSAIAFTVNTAGEHYAGDLTREVIVQRIATARGALGSSAEYLFRTRDGLRANGIPDPDIEALAVSVEAAIALQTGP